MLDAGAAATELNMYGVPGEPRISGTQLEQRHIEVLQRVKDAVTVPVAVKLSPFYSSLAEMAQLLDKAGADALVLFNRFLQPDIDAEELVVVPRVTLSSQLEGGFRGCASHCCVAGYVPHSPQPPAWKPLRTSPPTGSPAPT
jgi:dihydroorotate dehydrogenase (fumarate)